MRTSPRPKLAAFVLFLVLLGVVPPHPLLGGAASPPTSTASETERVARLNDIARFCAGMDVSERSDLCYLTQTKAWRDYAATENARWEEFRKIGTRMRAWADSQLRPRGPSTRVVFYPFGGPDILYADIFMPGADLYILVGLEDVGAAPDAETIWKSPLKSFLAEYSRALDDVLRFSFFRRFDMKEELSGKTIQGLLPVFMVLLARMDKELVAVETGSMTEGGEFTAAPASPMRPARVLRIRYRNPGDGSISTMVYFSQDLSNGPLDNNKGFSSFVLEAIPHCFSFIKSASYLMHNKGFSHIRSMVLGFSDAILQDDSGIAYRFFDPRTWTITLYGAYRGPIPLFKEYYEANLCEAYLAKAKPLSFRYGYTLRSNILWAVKKNR